MKKYIIDNFILSVFYHVLDEEILDRIYYEITERQKIMVNELIKSTLSKEEINNELIAKYLSTLTDSAENQLTAEEEKLISDAIEKVKLNDSIEFAMNAFNKLIYDQAIPNLTENEILDINTYIDMVEEKMIENNQSYLKIIEEELNKRKTIENQSVITPTINLGGVMSNPAAYNSDTPIL